MFLYSSAIQSYTKVVLSSIESALKNLTNASPFPLKMELLVILQPEIVITISSMYMQDFVGWPQFYGLTLKGNGQNRYNQIPYPVPGTKREKEHKK